MSGLLVSVRDVEEALRAKAAGADLIDFKEPRAGALGRPEDGEVVAMLDALGPGAATSLALGDLRDYEDVDFGLIDGRLRYAKVGLAGALRWEDWSGRLEEAMVTLPDSVGRVVAAYADWRTAVSPRPDEIVDVAGRVGCEAVLLDTFGKSDGNLVEVMGVDAIRAFVDTARQRGLRVVLAGSLDEEAIGELLPIGPDYFGVRGAACGGTRDGEIDSACVEQLVCGLAFSGRGEVGLSDNDERASRGVV